MENLMLGPVPGRQGASATKAGITAELPTESGGSPAKKTFLDAFVAAAPGPAEPAGSDEANAPVETATDDTKAQDAEGEPMPDMDEPSEPWSALTPHKAGGMPITAPSERHGRTEKARASSLQTTGSAPAAGAHEPSERGRGAALDGFGVPDMARAMPPMPDDAVSDGPGAGITHATKPVDPTAASDQAQPARTGQDAPEINAATNMQQERKTLPENRLETLGRVTPEADQRPNPPSDIAGRHGLSDSSARAAASAADARALPSERPGAAGFDPILAANANPDPDIPSAQEQALRPGEAAPVLRGVEWSEAQGLGAAIPRPATDSVQVQRAEIPRHVSLQIAEAVQRGGDTTVELTLNPAELGRVRISLSGADAGMMVSITAERPETLDLLRRHIDMLAQDFRDLGYDTAEFAFGRGGDGPTPGQGDTSGRREGSDAEPDVAQGHIVRAGVLTDRVDIRV